MPSLILAVALAVPSAAPPVPALALEELEKLRCAAAFALVAGHEAHNQSQSLIRN